MSVRTHFGTKNRRVGDFSFMPDFAPRKARNRGTISNKIVKSKSKITHVKINFKKSQKSVKFDRFLQNFPKNLASPRVLFLPFSDFLAFVFSRAF